jgi:hypothetical protein
MVLVAMPGERWEVAFLSDGSIEVERFISNGEISGEDALRELFAQYLEEDHDHRESSQRASQQLYV